MKTSYLFFLVMLSFPVMGQFSYQKTWSTYYQGSNSGVKNSVIDSDGNIIVVGTINNSIAETFPQEYYPLSYYEFWATSNAYQTTIIGDFSEGFITKFSPDGAVLWSTFFGGNQSDVVFNVAVDSSDNIYITGTTFSTAAIATTGAFIDNYTSIVPASTNEYPEAFLAKFSASGSIQWSTYIPGIAANTNDPIKLYIEKNTDSVYISGYTIAANGNLTTSGVFQEIFYNYTTTGTENPSNGFILKFDAQGNRIAGTYCGAGARINGINSDSDGNIIIAGSQRFDTGQILATANSFQPLSNGSNEGFILKVTPDLTTRLWCTYYGESGIDSLTKIGVYDTDIYICGTSGQIGTGSFATPGAFSETPSKGYMAKFTGSGSRVWGTYFPFIVQNSWINSFVVKNNKIYLAGRTFLNEGISTPNVYQENKSLLAYADGFFMQFNSDGSRNWGSYFGGNAIVELNSIAVLNDDVLYLSGATEATDIATVGSWQPNLDTGPITATLTGNMFLTKFASLLATNDFATNQLHLAPNPNHGRFLLSGSLRGRYAAVSMVIYDNLGRVIMTQEVPTLQDTIKQEFDFSGVLQKGIYFVKLTCGNDNLQTFKMLVQ